MCSTNTISPKHPDVFLFRLALLKACSSQWPYDVKHGVWNLS
jgi:hypothetical protein